MSRDRVFILLQLLGAFTGTLITDCGGILSRYLVSLLFLNPLYFILQKRVSDGLPRLLLIVSPLLLFVTILFVQAF